MMFSIFDDAIVAVVVLVIRGNYLGTTWAVVVGKSEIQ
jgi:hypothetical protein